MNVHSFYGVGVVNVARSDDTPRINIISSPFQRSSHKFKKWNAAYSQQVRVYLFSLVRLRI